ncbi:MAG: hypothetical protein CR974_04345 [Gammaproteobacteria bacterium]|nr:MAG: hypothetical protein CR974_04345 [Gammaproteobacteria bacterium]
MKTKQLKSTCTLCHASFTRIGMRRHLRNCLKKHSDAQGKTAHYLHVYSLHNPDYFLHILMTDKATLHDLDQFLRDIWVECCGHMSRFSRTHWGDEISMNKTLHAAFRDTNELEYLYDFGDTTELWVAHVGNFQHTPLKGKETALLLARNAEPQYPCDECGKGIAQFICQECHWEGGWLCEKCAEHHECDKDMMMPVVNSPRTGVCGYA